MSDSSTGRSGVASKPAPASAIFHARQPGKQASKPAPARRSRSHFDSPRLSSRQASCRGSLPSLRRYSQQKKPSTLTGKWLHLKLYKYKNIIKQNLTLFLNVFTAILYHHTAISLVNTLTVDIVNRGIGVIFRSYNHIVYFNLLDSGSRAKAR